MVEGLSNTLRLWVEETINDKIFVLRNFIAEKHRNQRRFDDEYRACEDDGIFKDDSIVTLNGFRIQLKELMAEIHEEF